jgi:transcriptional regulator with XRE-family HTH domain
MGCRQKAFLEHEEVMELLRSEIARAGGQRRLAEKMGMDRTQLSKMLHGAQVLSKRVIKALKLRVVYAPDDGTEGARGVKNPEQKVAAAPQKLFEALRELVEQIENGNGRDDHGHPLRNLRQLREARAIVDEIPPTTV